MRKNLIIMLLIMLIVGIGLKLFISSGGIYVVKDGMDTVNKTQTMAQSMIIEAIHKIKTFI